MHFTTATYDKKEQEAMNETAEESNQYTSQADFEKLTTLVSAEFQIEEALMEHDLPTYYLKQPQETKQPFLRLLKNLEAMNLIALLRRKNERIFLKIVPKPPVKSSNILINWILFFATIATTFVTGYMLSRGLVEEGAMSNPFVGGATFTIAIMAVLGMHEMGHKLTADKKGIEATPPYFIPGPPPVLGIFGIGTFGAVIMQKSLPPNKDALFDVGANGPIVGFILSVIVSIVGLLYSPRFPIPPEGINGLPAPLIFEIFAIFVVNLPTDYYILLHPVATAGWVGMVVTMLNLLPAAMLDGGHVARSLVGEKTRSILTFMSILLLIISGFWPMAIFVLFISMRKHPGPLDDVSSLSTNRKLLTIGLIAIFVLCSFPIVSIF
jgi:membrane-associated protease RseP (regulator of RpoE activity)